MITMEKEEDSSILFPLFEDWGVLAQEEEKKKKNCNGHFFVTVFFFPPLFSLG